MEKLGEPGSARYGNFINYYSFNPPERRVKLIPATLLADCIGSCKRDTVLALDVGCNTGVSTTPEFFVVVVFLFQYNQNWTSLPSIILSRIQYHVCDA